MKDLSNDAGREREDDWAGKIKFWVSEIGWEVANTVGANWVWVTRLEGFAVFLLVGAIWFSNHS